MVHAGQAEHEESVAPDEGAAQIDLTGSLQSVTTTPQLSVIVPTYRDRDRIAGNLQRLEAALDTTGLTWEVVVVVDGDESTRRHAEACETDRIHIHAYSLNRGKGFALRLGMLHARGDLVTLCDSDMEIGPEEIGRMASLLKLYQADIVVGSKRHPLSQVQYPRLRRFQSWCYQRLVHILFRVQVRDTQTGLKMMRREVAQRVLGLAVVKRFAFDLELLALASRFGYRRIIEAPVVIDYKFSSTTNLRAAWQVLWDTMAIFYRMRIRHWYDRRDGHGLLALNGALPAVEITD